MSRPDFENLLQVLRREAPARPTLFEFFLNQPFYEKFTGKALGKEGVGWEWGTVDTIVMEAFVKAGYDYLTVLGSDMSFGRQEAEKKKTISLNAGSAIRDRKSFESYDWPEPDSYDYSRLEKAKSVLPDGMKLICYSNYGLLENVLLLVGFERLCMMLVDEPGLAKDIFNSVGERLVRYYEICSPYESVGALISNDDWGFKTATMLSPEQMREYIFPWHRRIVEVIHASGKPAILHSCGNLNEVMDEIIDDMKYDAKHSFEDTIIPVEQAYEQWGERIAILGGIDMDFICRATPQQITKRCEAMLARVKKRGGYALGTGNSVPEYVPWDNYIAMIDCVRRSRD